MTNQTKIITLNANTKEIVTVHACYGQIGQKLLNANTKEIITLLTCYS